MHGYTPSGLGAAQCLEHSMADLLLQPCGLGCQQLGPYHYACSAHHSVHGHFASNGIVSCPAPLPCSPGEDDSPKPSHTKSGDT